MDPGRTVASKAAPPEWARAILWSATATLPLWTRASVAVGLWEDSTRVPAG